MKYCTIQPSDSLKPFVRCFWILEHEFGEHEQSYIYRSIADSCVEIVFHYRATFDELLTVGQPHNLRSGIIFQADHYTRFETKGSFGIFGVYIYPFAVPWLFGVPSSKTSNKMLDLDTFLGNEGVELEEKIMLALDNYQRVEILSAFLGNKFLQARRKDSTIAVAVKHVIHSNRVSSVTQLQNISIFPPDSSIGNLKSMLVLALKLI
jgi:hypothetical protein